MIRNDGLQVYAYPCLEPSELQETRSGRKQHKLFSQHILDETADAAQQQQQQQAQDRVLARTNPVENVHFSNGLRQVGVPDTKGLLDPRSSKEI